MGTGKCHFRFVVKQDIQDIATVHIVMKESLNSDGQQFHQYQQNKQSHFTKRKFKQRWSTIPPISTKQTITFHKRKV
jgi:nitric oxide synthase oxygenase domain/subunit